MNVILWNKPKLFCNKIKINQFLWNSCQCF